MLKTKVTTEQEALQLIYDTACRGLSKQGFEQSTSKSANGCAYRGVNGLRCAIGHCIINKYYSTRFEGNAVGTEITDAVRKSLKIPAEFMPLWSALMRLQECHDQNRLASAMRSALIAFAEDNKLTPHPSLFDISRD